ncbi:Trp biosynthesis-associated membrane protein [Microbacterium sp. cf046]|uniref:Trp biosynthesis-associated membrane protein n=1 Tax=Microbacterium sp. cf046 TaxID=1761803 RepID=UPI0020C924A5|nr:Trp biosynthesis-associated membrane protein [Microbacterium sp. cf046]
MIRRARLLSVVAVLAVGATGIISSTQTWLVATLDDGAGHELAVSGAAAVPVLAPLSLAVLALGAALSIVGLVLRYVFGVLTVAIAATLGFLSAQVAITTPVSAVASTVTGSTGITGIEAVDALVATITPTAWPAVTLTATVILLAAGLAILVTARAWRRSGRRYEADAVASAEPHGGAPASRPHDAIDSWDDLSRGADPTADPTAGPR